MYRSSTTDDAYSITDDGALSRRKFLSAVLALVFALFAAALGVASVARVVEGTVELAHSLLVVGVVVLGWLARHEMGRADVSRGW